jgi:hypothetical protein
MGTRTIVTSQPDVACYVCERRLLRGEQPEVFLAAGRPRTVCELCAPRAAHAGWQRESDHQSVSVPPQRSRRGRNLFQRLRQTRGGTEGSARDVSQTVARDGSARDGEPREYDFLGGSTGPDAEPSGVQVEDRWRTRTNDRPPPAGTPGARGAAGAAALAEPHSPAASPEGLLDRAIEVFNAGDYPRRVAGLARSLGVPGVSVRPVEGIPNAVTIVVAWELCWYEYRVDLDEHPLDARVLAQGTELSELAREDRLGNADVDELGALSMLAPAASG